HAYLFSGSRGTGKTSLARIFARAVGCSEKDLYEIDAASHTGVDNIRELRDAVAVLPFESPYKVYIIDEVHMLSKGAFNALLKTLEEPPSHVLFILATTELEKLPETIISRCQTFSFKKPTQKIVRDMVAKVAKKEGFVLEPASADLIALLSEGSFRDAHGILQKIIASSHNSKVSVEEVEEVTGAPKGELVNEILKALHEENVEVALSVVGKAVKQNTDMALFIRLLIEKVRAVLLLRFAPEMEKDIREEHTEEDMKFLTELAKEARGINSALLSSLLEAQDTTKRAAITQLPIELALINRKEKSNG
ncbi:MAG: DNA polymerase III subunit gamma/tau, partial [Candidatus Paceibacterota bacterium]